MYWMGHKRFRIFNESAEKKNKQVQQNAYKINKVDLVFNGNALFYKTGTTNGFHAYIGVIPSQKIGVFFRYSNCI